MAYNTKNLRWENNKYALYPYYPWRSTMRNEMTEHILDFKHNIPGEVKWFQQCSAEAVVFLEANFRHYVKDLYVIAAPCSAAHKDNVPCEQVGSYLGAHFSWLHYVPRALIRIKDVPKAAFASKEGRPRPTREDHLRTIRYQGERLYPSYGIIVIDDIWTTSSTFDACHIILKSRTQCEPIFGLFMGRTQSV